MVFTKTMIEGEIMNLDKLKHFYTVAIKMVEIGKSMNLTEEQLEELFVLGLNHDIGYQFTNTSDIHNKVGGEVLKRQNYKYWKEVYYHGEINPEYESLYLDILNLSDMQVTGKGEDVGFDKRLLGIKERYGEDSNIYKKCSILIEQLKEKYSEQK